MPQDFKLLKRFYKAIKYFFTINGHFPVLLWRLLHHQYYFAGHSTEEEIKLSFLDTLKEVCSKSDEVSYGEFEDYYEGLSIGVVDDEDFVTILRTPWGI